MKRLIVLVTGIIICSIASSNAQETWSLQKCIDYALENNITIKQQSINTVYQNNLLSQAKSNRLPNLNASLSNNQSFGKTLNYDNTYKNINSSQYGGSLSSNMTLWNGHTLKNTIKQRNLDLQASIQDLQKVKEDISLLIASAYLEILFAEELTKITEGQIEVTKQQIERTNHLVEAGSLAKGALLEIEAQLSQEDLQLVNDQNRAQLAYLNLFQILDLPFEKSFKVEIPDLPEIGSHLAMINSADVYKTAVAQRPEIKGAQLRLESSKRQLDVAKGRQYPNLSLGANYYNNYNNKFTDLQNNKISFGDQLKNNKRYGIGLNLNIPVFNNYQVRNGIANANLQVMDFELQLQSTSNELRKDIEQAYTNALAALKRYISSDKAVNSTAEAFRYVEEKYNVGMVNSVEYNQSKNNLTSAQSNYLQAKYDYIFRTKILDFYNGIPIEL